MFICIFRIRHPFISKCLLRMRKRRKSNLVRIIIIIIILVIFYDGQKFRRQCVNVIDTMWGCIYFSTCENFRWNFWTQCAMALSPKFSYVVFHIRYPKNPSHTETLHTESNVYKLIRWETISKPWSLQAVRMTLLSSRFLKREKERKYWVHPILRYSEEGEFLSLLRSSGVITADSKFTSGRQWLSLMLC